MHSLKRFTIAAVTTAAGTLLAPTAASAEIGGPGQPQPSNDEYSHAADFVAASGSRGASTSKPCTIESSDPAVNGKPAHIEWNTYVEGDGTYSVYLNCVLDGEDVPSGDRSHGENWEWPDTAVWRVLWSRTGIVPQDREELVADILARLRPADAGIHTDPGGDRPTMVAIPTWLWLDPDTYGVQTISETDGPVIDGTPLLRVTIIAEPKPGADVVWSMGDGSVTCPDGGLPAGSCTYEYGRSSAGQEVDPDTDLPSYTVTASYTYTGTYQVYVMGALIDSGPLGDIERVSSTTLAVNEAQAINTRSGG